MYLKRSITVNWATAGRRAGIRPSQPVSPAQRLRKTTAADALQR
ncbi:hypothetical protein UMZ34_11970 [Halopseudomonas pachastrellae]|nr:hypothetical protein UMZ34_11970 [Halopseudomonas pachastrellae]